MKIINEIKVCNGEVIKEWKSYNRWRDNCSRFSLYDEHGKFIRFMKKKEVNDYINYNLTLIEISKFKKWKEGVLNE